MKVISVVVQVGNKFGDQHTDVLAGKLADDLRGTPWANGDETDGMRKIVESLDTDLQHMVLRKAWKEPGYAVPIPETLHTWPVSIQDVRHYRLSSCCLARQLIMTKCSSMHMISQCNNPAGNTLTLTHTPLWVFFFWLWSFLRVSPHCVSTEKAT